MKIDSKIFIDIAKVIRETLPQTPILFNDSGMTMIGVNYNNTLYSCIQIKANSFEDYSDEVHKFIVDTDLLSAALLSCKDIIEFEFSDNDSQLIIKNIKNDRVTKKISLRANDLEETQKEISGVPKSLSFELSNGDFKELLADFSSFKSILFTAKETLELSAKNNSMEINKIIDISGNGEQTKITLELLKNLKDIKSDLRIEFGNDTPLQIKANDKFKSMYFVVAQRGE